MKLLTDIITKFLLPLAVIYFAFKTNIFLGFFAIIAVIAYSILNRKETFYGLLGRYHYSKDNLDKAIKWYEKAAALDFPKTNTIVSYAYLLLKTGETEKPEQLVTRL